MTAKTAFQFQLRAAFDELNESEPQINAGIFKALYAQNERLLRLNEFSLTEYQRNRDYINEYERKYF